MIISHSRKFTFVHVHKAGGTSIEKALDPYLAWNDLMLGGSLLGERMQAPYFKRFGLSKHSTVAEIEAVCGSQYIDEYFVFSLVRHPMARICSVYNYVAMMVTNWATREGVPLADVLKRATPEAIVKAPELAWISTRIFVKTNSFSEFIRHKLINQVPGFRPQAAALCRAAGGRPVGTVFRLEDYSRWTTILSERLNIDFVLPHANKSGPQHAQPESISPEDRALIRDLFRIDYETFDYRS